MWLVVVYLGVLLGVPGGDGALSAREWAFFVDLNRSSDWFGPGGIMTWNGSSDPCVDHWRGITCDSLNTSVVKITTQSLGPVTGLLPNSISNLTQLNYIYLGYNFFSGTIPPLSSLTLLTYLNLARNLFTGTIPSDLQFLTRLDTLYLQENTLNGTIPSFLGSLSLLSYLYLEENQLTGTIPSSLGNLQALLDLKLHTNFLVGTIPSSFENLFSLQYLDLSLNSLNGTIPSFASSDTLISLLIYSNDFIGTIPPIFQTCECQIGTDQICFGKGFFYNCSSCGYLSGGSLCVSSCGCAFPPSPEPIPSVASPIPSLSSIPTSPTSLPPPSPLPSPEPPIPLPPGLCSIGKSIGLCLTNSTSLNITNSPLDFINITNGNVTLIGNVSVTLLSITNSTLYIDGSFIKTFGNLSLSNGDLIIKNNMDLFSSSIYIKGIVNITVFGEAILDNSIIYLNYNTKNLNGEYVLVWFKNTSSTKNIQLVAPNSCSPVLKTNSTFISVLFNPSNCKTKDPFMLWVGVGLIGLTVVAMFIAVGYYFFHKRKLKEEMRTVATKSRHVS